MDTNDLEREVNTRITDAVNKIEFLCEYRADKLSSLSRMVMFKHPLLPLRRLSAAERAEVVATAKAYAEARSGGMEEERMRLLLRGFNILRKGRMDHQVRTVRTAVRCIGNVYSGSTHWNRCDSPYGIAVDPDDFRRIARHVMSDDEINPIVETAVAIARIARVLEQKHGRMVFGKMLADFPPDRILKQVDTAERIFIEKIRTW